MNDAELLQEYASNRSEPAFEELVQRHLPLVYSAAIRQVGDAALAKDIAQVVFIILARKAAELSSGTILAGWLFRTTRHVAAKATRSEQRRRHREQEAFQMQSAQGTDVWAQVAPCLDEALGQLGEVERHAVLLHFFEHKRLREVGLALGLSEDAAEKRVARAVEKLRRFLLKRQVALPAVVLPGLLMTHGAQVPPAGLDSSVLAVAIGKTVLSPSLFVLLQQALRESLWPHVALVLGKAAVTLILGGIVVSLTLHFWPAPSRQDPRALSFETKIVPRPRPVLPAFPSSPAAPVAVNTPKTTAASVSTNSAAPVESADGPSSVYSDTNALVAAAAMPKSPPAAFATNTLANRNTSENPTTAPPVWPPGPQSGYAQTWNNYGGIPGMPASTLRSLAQQGTFWQAYTQQLLQPAFYLEKGAWMPVQRLTPGRTTWNPSPPTKKAP